MRDRLATLALLGVACLAAAQVGIIRAHRSESSVLRHRLADLQARHARSERALEQDLAAERLRSGRLQARAERTTAEVSRLRAQLAATQQALELLQLSARGVRPKPDAPGGASAALRVEVAASADLARLLVRVGNAWGADVEVLDADARVWLGDRVRQPDLRPDVPVLASGAEIELFGYDLPAEELALAREDAGALRAALCLVWLPAGEQEAWLGSYWFERAGSEPALALVRRDVTVLAEDDGCDLEGSVPPW